MQEIEKKGAAALGISADSIERQAEFRDLNNLNMPLLADTDRKVAAGFGAYTDKLERTTFIIGKDGLIKKVFEKVKVDGHVEDVLKVLTRIANDE